MNIERSNKMFRTLYIDMNLLDQFIEKADNSKNEVCGMFLGRLNDSIAIANEYFPIENVSDYAQEVDYVMNPNDAFKVYNQCTILNKKSNKNLAVIIHSHPNHLPIPSGIDLNRADWEVVYIIYSPKYKRYKGWNFVKDEKRFYETPVLKASECIIDKLIKTYDEIGGITK